MFPLSWLVGLVLLAPKAPATEGLKAALTAQAALTAKAVAANKRVFMGSSELMVQRASINFNWSSESRQKVMPPSRCRRSAW